MNDDSRGIAIACRLLEMYNVSNNVASKDISNFETYKSKLYGMTKIYSFYFKGRHYYISDDYSLMDNPKLIRAVLEEVSPRLQGNPLKNPVPQSDGATYALGLDGKEYYLWEVPPKELL